MVPILSKSSFTTGWRCLRLLWWSVHEPLAEELQPDKVLQDRFDQGRHVGALARARFPDATLIPAGERFEDRVAATRHALATGVPVVLEAAFQAGGVRVAADVLRRQGDGFALTEVKSASSQKPEHIPDVAVQLHVLEANGLAVRRAEILHLNKAFRHPDQGDLFEATDVTGEARDALGSVPAAIRAQQAALAGPLPDVPIGLHCFEPHECPMRARCWPNEPRHISTLYNVGPKRTVAYLARGIARIDDLPPNEKLPDAARRQVRALAEGRVIVEPGLRAALAAFEGRLGFLDFETISRAVPVWDGMGPWHQAVAQFSYHEAQPDGGYRHEAYLAEGPHDARPELAERLLAATAGAERVVMYSSFERSRIRDLQRAVPALAAPLRELEAKLIDLLPVIREHVYHPDFRGSFSIKAVLHPLVPDLTYRDLVIVDGLLASVEIARLLFVAHKIPAHERDRLRQDLLDYCERDTWAMVRLLERLRGLAE